MATKLGKGFGVKDGRIYSCRHKLGDASAVIRRQKQAKRGKGKVSSRAKVATIKAQRPFK